MSEIDSLPGNPKIPEHWQFEEKSESLPVIQIDLNERYLALRRNYLNYSEEVTITDYFFDTDGLPSTVRSYTDFSGDKYSIDIKKRGETQVEYSFSHHEPYAMGVSFFKPEETSMSLLSTVANPMDGIFFASDGRLAIVRMARPWVKNNPNPPGIDFSNEQNEFVKKDWNCYKIFDLSGFRILDQAEPNKLVFVNKGKKRYVTVWDTVIEEGRDGKRIPFFVVTQSHFDADNNETRKILRSPIQIDMSTVRSALLSNPPYSKDESGKLVVPWRNIDRIVGASLSYSYPPPTPQTSQK